jgi:hypothetical protein
MEWYCAESLWDKEQISRGRLPSRTNRAPIPTTPRVRVRNFADDFARESHVIIAQSEAHSQRKVKSIVGKCIIQFLGTTTSLYANVKVAATGLKQLIVKVRPHISLPQGSCSP